MPARQPARVTDFAQERTSSNSLSTFSPYPGNDGIHGTSNRGMRPQPSPNPPNPGRRVRFNWSSVRQGVSQTWSATTRVFRLVWETSPSLTIVLALIKDVVFALPRNF